jgi:WD40 repeat protein/tRNA A-37 threonylcarbamoyl transferase component Bud32
MTKLNCVTDRDLKAFLLGELPERVADTVARHLETCADCLQRANLWDDVTDPAVQALRRVGPPEPALTSIDDNHEPENGKAAVAAPDMLAPAGFTLLEEIGRGAAGVVFKARQNHPDRVVALKFFMAGAHAAEQRARFLAEANAVALLNHPHIVQIHAVGEHGGQPYLCLEYVGGDHLGAKIGGRPQPPREAARLVELLARAIQHAHENGIVHRDLKPANVLLTSEGSPKVTDFGLARFGRADLTATGAVLGTPAYMSPEQARGDNAAVGPASDVWALGALLYELLTGQAPFRGVEVLDTLKLVADQEPVPPNRLQPAVPRDLNVICLKCLEKRPERRYAAAAELADDLKRVQEGLPIKARPVGVAERSWRWCRRKPALASAVILATIGAVATLSLSIWFAVFQYQANTELEQLNIDLDQANADLVQRQKETQAALYQSRLDSARLARESGLGLCRQGDVNGGLIWLAEALRLAPAEAEDLQAATRAQIAQWSPQATPLRHVFVHPQKVTALAFAPDGKTIYTGCSDAKFRRWDAATGKLLDESKTFGDWLMTIQPSTDGKTLRISSRKKDECYCDAASGEILAEKKGEFRELDSQNLMTSNNGKTTLRFIIAGGSPALLLAQVSMVAADGKNKFAQFKFAHRGRADSLSPDGRHVAFNANLEGFRVRSAETGAVVGFPIPSWDTFTKTVFHPNGRALLIADAHRNARVWEIHEGKWISPPLVHPAEITELAFSPDGNQILTGCADGAVRLWDWQRPSKPWHVIKLSKDAYYIAFSRDSRRAFVGFWKGDQPYHIHLYESETGKKLLSLPQQKHLSAVAMTPDGRILATGTNTGKQGDPGNVMLWNGDSGEKIGPTLAHPRGIFTLSFSPDGKNLATLCHDGKVRFWQTANGAPLKTELQQPEYGPLTYSTDGRLLLTGSRDGSARLWNVQEGRLIDTYFHPSTIHAVAIAPDGNTILIGGSNRTARLRNVTTAKPLGSPLIHPQLVSTVAFSPDGHIAVTCGEGRVQLWESSTGQPIGPPAELFPHGRIRALAFTPEGQRLVIGAENAICHSRVPLTVPGDSKAVSRSVQTLTGCELNADREIQALDGKEWHNRSSMP